MQRRQMKTSLSTLYLLFFFSCSSVLLYSIFILLCFALFNCSVLFALTERPPLGELN